VIRLEGITRRCGTILANDDITLEVEAGTIHGLVGENGAGKTTLMRVLYGLDRPDAGRVVCNGRPVRIASPRDALALGIGMVHQHFMLVPTLSVLDNIILGDEPGRFGVLDRAAARARLRDTAGRAADGLELDAPVGTLTVGQQQRVEILKLLYRRVRLLILDEPTAVLAPGEADALFAELLRLKSEGRTIVLITHRLAEVLGHTDRVSVLRRGRLVATRRTDDTSLEELAGMIVGDGDAARAARMPPGEAPRAAPDGATSPVLELSDIHIPGDSGRGGLRGASLSVRPGEIVALLGVEGNGQSELARVAAGRLRPAEGTLLRDGAAADPAAGPPAPADVGYIPEDRLRDAVIPALTAAENLLLGRHREARFARNGRIDRGAVAAHAARLLDAADVRPAEPERPVAAFSGGNQQKLVLAREIEEGPRLVVAAHPTRGLDLVATRRVLEGLRAARARGAGVLLVTSEPDEARGVADRLVVLYDGRVAGELPPTATDAELGRLMTGGVAG
jgi:ABC-type uncharacterized transport system ATPase subunit